MMEQEFDPDCLRPVAYVSTPDPRNTLYGI
jgi:hypothetical protein